MMPTLAIATAHAFVVLTVSHGLLFRQPLDYMPRHGCRRFLAQFSAERRPIFASPDLSSRYLVSIPGLAVTRPAIAPSPSVLPFGQNSAWRAARTCALSHEHHDLKHHDLNLAILYAVQSGFRYSVSLFMPDLRC
jgi:hypothetical protein